MKKSFVKIGILSLMACACAGVGVANLQIAKAESNVQCVGAYIKFKTGEKDSGLRFGFTLNDNVFADVTADTLTFANESTTFGIMLYPTDYDAEENVVNVEISANQFRKNDKGAMESYAYIYDLEESMYNAEFTAVGYLTIDGETEYTTAVSRSMASVAYAAVNDPNLPETDPRYAIAEKYLLEYDVTLKVDGETYETESVRYGNGVTTVAPEKAGYVFTGWTYENGNAFDVVTGDCTLVATYAKNIKVANVSLKKSVGTTVALNAESLGLTFNGVDESTVSYEVVKTVGASTTLGTAIAATESFVVETGCLYDVTVTAQTTKGDSVKAYVQVSDEDVIVLAARDFKMASPTQYVATTEYITLENGMEVAKVYNNSGKQLTLGIDNPVVWFDGPNQKLQYKFYVTVRHNATVDATNWGIQYSSSGYIAKTEGRYLLGASSSTVGDNGYHQFNLTVIMSRLNGTDLYAMFENIVLVPIEGLTKEATNVTKAVGATVNLATDIGVTQDAIETISYSVTKTVATQTQKVAVGGALETTVDVTTSRSFTVEEDCFYDVYIDAVGVSGKAYKAYVQVIAEGLKIINFNDGQGKLALGTDLLTYERITDEYGNEAYKMYVTKGSSVGTTNTGVNISGISFLDISKKYDMYMTVRHATNKFNASGHGFTFQYKTNSAYVDKKDGRYMATSASYETFLYWSYLGVEGRHINGVDNWVIFDNIVFVEK